MPHLCNLPRILPLPTPSQPRFLREQFITVPHILIVRISANSQPLAALAARGSLLISEDRGCFSIFIRFAHLRITAGNYIILEDEGCSVFGRLTRPWKQVGRRYGCTLAHRVAFRSSERGERRCKCDVPIRTKIHCKSVSATLNAIIVRI